MSWILGGFKKVKLPCLQNQEYFCNFKTKFSDKADIENYMNAVDRVLDYIKIGKFKGIYNYGFTTVPSCFFSNMKLT